MSDNDTLLAHLVPVLTPQVEVAATKALAFILNKSELCLQSLQDLVQDNEFTLEQLTHAEAEVAFEDGGRVDLVCYHNDDDHQLLIEAKFWASLGEHQASAYFDYLDRDRPGMLMVLAPDRRTEAIWPEILSQLERAGWHLNTLEAPQRCRLAKESDSNRRVMLVSWAHLLDCLTEAAEQAVKSDILQLRGLAQKQDEEVPLPLHADDLKPEIARRLEQFHRIIDDASERASTRAWFQPTSRTATAYRVGYGRGFAPETWHNSAWFGLEYGVWSTHGRSPLWVQVHTEDWPAGSLSMVALEDPYGRRHFRWVPIELKLGAEHDEVIADVVAQLKSIVHRDRSIQIRHS